jgi:cytochrome c oxidase assembly protein subunit 11
MNSTISQKNLKLARNLVIIALAMFGFGYALVPLYDVFCEVVFDKAKPGLPVVIQEQSYSVDRSRQITVEFLTTLDQKTPMIFRAETKRIQVHPGEYATVNFYAENTSDKLLTAQAIPSFSPAAVYKYFEKTQCFCFSQQSFKAHEHKLMPMRFVVKPDLPAQYKTITLSYTFFDTTEKISIKNK